MSQVKEFFIKMFDASDWPPRWHCGNWSTFHGWLYIISDLLVWSAYFTIPLIIIKYITRKTNAQFVKLYFLFAAFILACGTTHFLDAVTFWIPVYRLNASVRLITGVLSWITVAYLVRLLPVAFTLRTSADMEHEIEQRKRAEQEVKMLNEQLKELLADKTNEVAVKEERFRSIIEHSYDAISLLDASFKPIYRNASAIKMTGWTEGEPEHINWLQRIHPEDEELVKAVIIQLTDNPGTAVNCSFRTKNKTGDYIRIDGSVTNLLHDAYVKAIVMNFRDITEKSKIEEELAKSIKVYRAIAANLPRAVITIIDTDRRYVLVEGEALTSLGYSKARMEGRYETEVLHPDDYKILKPHKDSAFEGVTTSEEVTINNMHMLTRYVPLRDEHKNVFAVMTIALDITEIKEANMEIVALNETLERKVTDRTKQLEMANKELESFSYSVSHDLRAPLRVINGYTDILRAEYSGDIDEEGDRMLGIIMNNTVRMGKLIDELLNLSRLGRLTINLQLTDMNEMVKDVLDEQLLLHPHPITFSTGFLLPAICDSRLIRHVWVNLISNAVKYSAKEYHPAIEVRSEKRNDEIVFSIKDNGVGFDMQYSGKLFGVFQRLHNRADFEGTGVGLALVQRIISKHDGRVWAEAEENKGATFYFSLPVKPNGYE